MTLCFVISGIFLNIFCIYVFFHFRRNGSPVIQYYLVALTFWQTALLANAFMLYCLPTMLYGHIVPTGSYVYVYPYAYALANTTHTGSVWIVLTLTIDRWLALCRPLTHRAIGKKSRVKRLMIVVSVVAIVFSLPRFFEVTITFVFNENGTYSEPTVARAPLTQNRTYWTIYHIILAMLFVTVTPCLLLFALTVRISLALRRAIIRRRHMCKSGSAAIQKAKENGGPISTKKEHKANVMLVLVITKFLLSDILPTVADVLEHLVGNQVFMTSPLATLFVDISNFLLVLNCSTNFWVFFCWGKRFRRCCLYLLASSTFGRALQKWFHIAYLEDIEINSNQGYFPNMASSTTNLTIHKKSRSRCCSPNFFAQHAKRSFAGFERATVANGVSHNRKSLNHMILRQNHLSLMFERNDFYRNDQRLYGVSPTQKSTQLIGGTPPPNGHNGLSHYHHRNRHRIHNIAIALGNGHAELMPTPQRVVGQ